LVWGLLLKSNRDAVRTRGCILQAASVAVGRHRGPKRLWARDRRRWAGELAEYFGKLRVDLLLSAKKVGVVDRVIDVALSGGGRAEGMVDPDAPGDVVVGLVLLAILDNLRADLQISPCPLEMDLGGHVGGLEPCFGASVASAGGSNKGSLAVFGCRAAATSPLGSLFGIAAGCSPATLAAVQTETWHFDVQWANLGERSNCRWVGSGQCKIWDGRVSVGAA